MLEKKLVSGGILAVNVLALALFLSGCAQSPESIQPAYVSTATYANWTCPQLAEESGHLQAALSQASQQQDDARTGDTLGVLFLGLPVSSMSGSNVAPEVARLKGTINAVHEAQTRNNCAAAPTPPTKP